MTPEQFEKLMTAQREQYKLLKQILEVGRSLDKKLEIIVSDREVKDSDYHKSLAEYKSFDWSSINARVLASDTDGVSAVEWRDRIYKRRSPENKLAPAIWFSRRDGDSYQKLISFKQIQPAEPISRKVLGQLSSLK